jgi:hypothetical protein
VGLVTGNYPEMSDWNEPVIEVSDETSIEGMKVDTETLTLVENTQSNQYEDTYEKIQTAARRYSSFWVYQRLLGNIAPEMPGPLANRTSVPDRDPTGTPAEQAVDAWMSNHEAEDSL